MGTTFPQCENNSYYTTQIYNFFKKNNFRVVKHSSEADAIVIVTCGFDDEREEDAFKNIDKYLDKYRYEKKIIVTGCLPKINTKLFKTPGLTIIPLQDLQMFNEIFQPNIKIQNIRANKINKNVINRGFKEDYYIQICQGCVNNCSYCAIKWAKGYVKSKPIENIIEEIKEGIARGFDRFVMLADDCGSYGIDINTDFANLLNEISALNEDIKLNIHYMFPQKLIELFDKINEEVWKKVYFMNVPLQSYSERILKLMNRNYDVNNVLDILSKIKKINKDIFLEAHLIFGFPQETVEETLSNLNLIKYYDHLTLFHYSDKKGTEASKLSGKLSNKEIWNRIKNLDNKIEDPEKIELTNKGCLDNPENKIYQEAQKTLNSHMEDNA